MRPERTSGSPQRSVILLHSSGLSGRQWGKAASSLEARGIKALAPDLTGHGARAPWVEPRPFSFRDDVGGIVSLVEQGDEATLVGHSYGGLVALHAARAIPSKVRGLVLFDPVAFGAIDPAADGDAHQELHALDLVWGSTAEERETWLRRFVEYWSGKGAWAALREEARAEFRRVAWVVREGVRSLMEDKTPASGYRAIECPVLLLTGEKSPVAARTVVRRLGDALAGSRTVVIPGAGHMGPVSHAELVNAAILEAVAPTAAPAPAGP